MATASCTLIDLRVNYFRAPLGIDEEQPRFSWKMSDSRQAACQRAYCLQVTAPDGPCWESGWIASRNSVQIAYAGAPLRPLTRYVWRVMVKDLKGKATPWSASSFETGFLFRKWQGTWIQGTHAGVTLQPATYFRTSFVLPAKQRIRRARLFASALGTYQASLNGKNVSDAVLAPGWTDYHVRVPYQAYDVTGLLRHGANAIGIILGDGWYAGEISYWCTHSSRERPHYALPPAIRTELRVEYQDGSQVIVGSDPTWRCSQGGPIRSSDIYQGEVYDSRLEMAGWDEPGFEDAGWNLARLTSRTQRMVWSSSPPVRRQAAVKPVSVHKLASGAQVIDFGQNMAGRERFTLRAPAGTTITIKHGEMLNPDGTVYTGNLGYARTTTTYVANGRRSTYEPAFTFYGFRYLEISGWLGAIAPDAFVALPICSDMERTGYFTCSNPLVNRLYENVIWGQRSNYIDVPTDCPQRSERQGWTGDAQVFINAGSYNYQVGGFFNKWLADLESSRNADGEYPVIAPAQEKWSTGVSGWADAGIICPWQLYRKYGDTALLARHYAAMRQWIFFQRDNSDGLIRKASEYADWLNLDAPTSEELVSTAFFAHGAALMAKIAALLGKPKDAREFEDLFRAIKVAYIGRFIAPDGALRENTQTAALLTLRFGLAHDAASRSRIARDLAADVRKRGTHLSTGFLGTPHLAPVLSDYGESDLAYALLEQTSYPSWLYPVTQGATTIWERWNSWTHAAGFGPAGMNSFNHYAYGAVADFLYEYVGGIRPDDAQGGFGRFCLAPVFGGTLTHAQVEYRSEYGAIVSSWRKTPTETIWAVVVPANTEAQVRFPARSLKAIRSAEIKVRSLSMRLPAGRYTFRIDNTQGRRGAKGMPPLHG